MKKQEQNEYFQQINHTLKNYKRAVPFLLIDLVGLNKNIATLKANLPTTTAFRIVVKSLPCLALIEHIQKQANTNKLMVFHQPFLTHLTRQLDEKADVLLGKPMPIKTATYYYQNLPDKQTLFNPYQQIQWLVDTPERIQEYIDLAKQLGKKLRLNVEIDVGLHRGGFGDLVSLKKGLELIQNNSSAVTFTGFMGYDPHVVKLPRIIRSQAKALQLANDFYHQCKAFIQQEFPDLYHEGLTFNGAGSPTIHLHSTNQSPLNEVSVGSALVKPSTFDIPTLVDYQPACYIATPVLKKFKGTKLPAMEGMQAFLNLMSASNRQSYFIYGGFWKADYCFPEGIKQNSIFGASTNQTMLNAPATTTLAVDDFVFLRPHQSEFVFLQFGNILVLKDREIIAEWAVLNNH